MYSAAAEPCEGWEVMGPSTRRARSRYERVEEMRSWYKKRRGCGKESNRTEDPSAAVRVVWVERISTVLVPLAMALATPESAVPVRTGRWAMASAVAVASRLGGAIWAS